MRTLIFMVLVAGCTDNKKPCEEVTFDALDSSPTDLCVALDISSPVAFDRLDTYTTFAMEFTGGVLTPEMIAAGEVVPATSLIFRTGGGAPTISDPPTTTYTGEIVSQNKLQPYLGVAATRNGKVVATAGTDLVESRIGEALNFNATLTLLPVDASPDVEIWGTGHGLNPCARITTATRTVFFVLEGDADCDGVSDSTDCANHTYCDPTAGACACP